MFPASVNDCLTCIGVVFAYFLWSWQKSRKSGKYLKDAQKLITDDNYSFIKLLPSEKSMKFAGAVSCITFYEGGVDIVGLKSKVLEIVKANPWLSGRLMKFQSVW